MCGKCQRYPCWHLHELMFGESKSAHEVKHKLICGTVEGTSRLGLHGFFSNGFISLHWWQQHDELTQHFILKHFGCLTCFISIPLACEKIPEDLQTQQDHTNVWTSLLVTCSNLACSCCLWVSRSIWLVLTPCSSCWMDSPASLSVNVQRKVPGTCSWGNICSLNSWCVYWCIICTWFCLRVDTSFCREMFSSSSSV